MADRIPTTMSIDINDDVQVTEHPVLDSCHLYNSDLLPVQRAFTQPTQEEKLDRTRMPDDDLIDVPEVPTHSHSGSFSYAPSILFTVAPPIGFNV